MTAAGSYAVIVPAYRSHLTDDEALSLRHLEHFLPEAEKILVMPETLEFRRNGYREVRFAPSFFHGITGYNRRMLSREFYAEFEGFDYILIHQLDALVLHSDIETYLALGVDYLGAPWVDHDADGAPFLTHVGNGGLSLRRVSAFLRLLDSPAPRTNVREYYRRGYSRGPRRYRPVGLYKACLRGLGIRPSLGAAVAKRLAGDDRVDFGAEARDYIAGGAAEDRFISFEAGKYSPGFVFGSLEQALQFAFEREPRFCYEKAGGRLPFGAHAWSRYDRQFWEPYLLA